KKNGDTGIVETMGVKKTVFLNLVDAGVGDHVLVHAGVAIGKVDEKETEETMALLKELMKKDNSNP
ncbi:MAG: HypC/HybG/HupF family hydrogenase formation chaperone, partial [Deltaproteobacteria bacterium]